MVPHPLNEVAMFHWPSYLSNLSNNKPKENPLSTNSYFPIFKINPKDTRLGTLFPLAWHHTRKALLPILFTT